MKKTMFNEPFLKGPIPMSWLQAAAVLPGRALHVGLAIWHLVGLRSSETVLLSGFVLKGLHVDRYATRRALRSLEGAGLVSVERHRGRRPRVTVERR
jgi:hypothetical protein